LNVNQDTEKLWSVKWPEAAQMMKTAQTDHKSLHSMQNEPVVAWKSVSIEFDKIKGLVAIPGRLCPGCKLCVMSEHDEGPEKQG
jgi:hypothetical protein